MWAGGTDEDPERVVVRQHFEHGAQDGQAPQPQHARCVTQHVRDT